jgi:hypothetical protein
MTGDNKPKEQIAFDYRRRNNEPGRKGSPIREEQSSTQINSNSHKRVVTMPKEIVEPTHWANRQAHQRRSQAHPRPRNRLVKRTLANTGMPAVEGQVRVIRPLPQQSKTMGVPIRSGRQKARGGSFWRRILTIVALLVIGFAGGSFALSSTNFRIQQIDIMGTQNQMLVESIQHMGIQGQNIFLLDVGDLTTRIEALPMVASANLSKQLPNLVIINIVARTPVLLWQTQQGIFSVDSKGVVIGPASDITGTAHLMTVLDAREGAAQQVHPGALLDAADIAFAMQAFRHLQQLAGVPSFTLHYDVVSGQASFIIVSSAGWLAYLGGSDDTNPLYNRLLELQQILRLAQQNQLNLATIDLRFGLRPVYTLKA